MSEGAKGPEGPNGPRGTTGHAAKGPRGPGGQRSPWRARRGVNLCVDFFVDFFFTVFVHPLLEAWRRVNFGSLLPLLVVREFCCEFFREFVVCVFYT